MVSRDDDTSPEVLEVIERLVTDLGKETPESKRREREAFAEFLADNDPEPLVETLIGLGLLVQVPNLSATMTVSEEGAYQGGSGEVLLFDEDEITRNMKMGLGLAFVAHGSAGFAEILNEEYARVGRGAFERELAFDATVKSVASRWIAQNLESDGELRAFVARELEDPASFVRKVAQLAVFVWLRKMKISHGIVLNQ